MTPVVVVAMRPDNKGLAPHSQYSKYKYHSRRVTTTKARATVLTIITGTCSCVKSKRRQETSFVCVWSFVTVIYLSYEMETHFSEYVGIDPSIPLDCCCSPVHFLCSFVFYNNKSSLFNSLIIAGSSKKTPLRKFSISAVNTGHP